MYFFLAKTNKQKKKKKKKNETATPRETVTPL